jgi:hypothetical protein
MPITQTEAPQSKPRIHLPDGSIAGEEKQKPLLQITLPAPSTGNPSESLSVGRHNFCAQKNFEKVSQLLMAIISNQKLMSLAITEQDKKIKDLQKNMTTISDNIRKSIEGDKNARPNQR